MLVFGALLMLFSGATIAFARTDAINTLWPAGQVRLASSYSMDSVDISGTGTQVLVQKLSIAVPRGKKADVQAIFSAAVHHNMGTYAYCFGQFSLDSTVPDPGFLPGKYQLIGGGTAQEPDAVTVSMSGFRESIGPGNHTINVYIISAYAGCEVMERALNVVVNIR